VKTAAGVLVQTAPEKGTSQGEGDSSPPLFSLVLLSGSSVIRHFGGMEPMLSRPVSRREPIFNIPLAVVGCIGVFFAIHGLRSFLSTQSDFLLLLRFSFIPGRWTVAWDSSQLPEALREAGSQGPVTEAAARLALARFVLSRPGPNLWSVLTYALLHGSWMHVLLNSLWLVPQHRDFDRSLGGPSS
jgi:membrane associated rhomboid family serine protease